MSDRPNILLISLDDAFAYWKYRSAFGVELQTPNLDRICAVSTAFHNAYCQVPVCGPSRSSFMSGLTPHELGIFDNYTSVFDVLRPEQMWPFRVKQAGYYCSNGGKVHHGYRPLPPDIHNVLYSHPPEAFSIGPGHNAKIADFGGLMRGHGTVDPAYDDRYYDAQSARAAARFLDGYDRDAPFYREVGFYHPHSPYKTPVRFKEMYDPAAFQQPEAWAGGHDRNDFAALYMQENIDGANLDLWQLLPEDDRARVTAYVERFWRCCSTLEDDIAALYRDARADYETKKDFAIRTHSSHTALERSQVFALWDGKRADAQDAAMQIIKSGLTSETKWAEMKQNIGMATNLHDFATRWESMEVTE